MSDTNYGQLSDSLTQLRRADARHLANQGHSLRDIAARLGVSYETVRRDLDATTPAGQMDTWIRDQPAQNRQRTNRGTLSGDDMDTWIRGTPTAHAQAGPEQTHQLSTDQQMDTWIRSPSAHNGATTGGTTTSDDYIHALYQRTEGDRRHRAAQHLKEQR